VAVLGVLGGAGNGGFTSLASLGLGSLVSLLGQAKEARGGRGFRLHCLMSLSLRNCFLFQSYLVFFAFRSSRLQLSQKTKAKFSPAPENFAPQKLVLHNG